MQCHLCQKNPASIALKRVCDGDTQELHVCQACAAQHGLDAQLPIPLLTDLLLGVGPAMTGAPGDDHACGACHMHQTDFHKTSLLGCPDCYTAFEREIAGLVETMHKDRRHFGKVPRRRMTGYLRGLERALETAGRAGHRGQAERLRLHLRELVRRAVAKPAAAPTRPPVAGTPEFHLE